MITKENKYRRQNSIMASIQRVNQELAKLDMEITRAEKAECFFDKQRVVYSTISSDLWQQRHVLEARKDSLVNEFLEIEKEPIFVDYNK